VGETLTLLSLSLVAPGRAVANTNNSRPLHSHLSQTAGMIPDPPNPVRFCWPGSPARLSPVHHTVRSCSEIHGAFAQMISEPRTGGYCHGPMNKTKSLGSSCCLCSHFKYHSGHETAVSVRNAPRLPPCGKKHFGRGPGSTSALKRQMPSDMKSLLTLARKDLSRQAHQWSPTSARTRAQDTGRTPYR